MKTFSEEVQSRLESNARDVELKETARAFMSASLSSMYSYNFSWLGRPIIQYPQDIVAMQEIIWKVQPDLIIETGIAHGGSLILSASMLELNASCGGPKDAEVVGVDIDIRDHNRVEIETHPLFRRISLIEGSSIDSDVVGRVATIASKKQRVLVCLDSNHTHDHVLAELNAYAGFTSVGSYCVVFDTIIDELPETAIVDRPWGRGNNPRTALDEYLRSHPEFGIDNAFDRKLLISVAPNGYLRRVS